PLACSPGELALSCPNPGRAANEGSASEVAVGLAPYGLTRRTRTQPPARFGSAAATCRGPAMIGLFAEVSPGIRFPKLLRNVSSAQATGPLVLRINDRRLQAAVPGADHAATPAECN